jgi:hypothetical protein
MLFDRGNALKRVIDLRSEPETIAMKTFITALTLLFALVGGISMIALAFRADFRQLAADNGYLKCPGQEPQ